MDLMSVTRLDADGFAAAIPELAVVLVDAVDSGASVGFVHPFDEADARRWWQAVADGVAQGATLLWVARDDEGVVGTVQIKLQLVYTNSRHRADLAKLLVHRRARGRGVGRRLLEAAERGAAQAGVTLLTLDTETGSPAEYLYRSAGWTELGVMPGHAADPAGVLKPTTYFYKPL
jgi:GNAT superfamily N-acetyltransferase